jgi:high-affinity Fe2+/Pb2+ permease
MDRAVIYRSSSMKYQRAISYLVFSFLLTTGSVLAWGFVWQGSKELHTVMEVTATLLALFIAVIGLVRFYSKKNNISLFIGTGFLGAPFLDGYHTVVTSSFFAEYGITIRRQKVCSACT